MNTEGNIPDPRLAALESALERAQEKSRTAAAQLAVLSTRESIIAQQHRPIDPPIVTGSGWTVDTTMAHLLALREGDRRFYEERDRRYAEVNIEREKALKIKETADLAALQLAREIQTYKDEKANQLREQINSERGNYPSKDELANAVREIMATIKPLAEYVSSQQGGTARGAKIQTSVLAWAVVAMALISATIGLIVKFA